MHLKIIKPFFEFLVALVVLVIFSPLFVVVTVVLFFFNGGKPFFFQVRPGKNEKKFRIIKFKTMSDKRDKTGELLPDEFRLTGFGKLIRKLSIDELPQMINVIKGDMSLVGPRPLLVAYLTLYSKEQRRRHSVKPGITGWAQVNGRNTLSWKEKFEHDVWYVDHMSFMVDCQILLKTVLKVFVSEGISSENSATMEQFEGE
jgi:lipopolysaccharide/colanic/teichoic acid biosynthesis glycosyltransferase